MQQWFKDWLFNGITASAVLMSISAFDAAHPLARSARIVGMFLAMLCLLSAALLAFVRWSPNQGHR
jgi:hypothetical protein